MIPLTLAELAAACGGHLADADPAAVPSAVTCDSRAVASGQLFVGLRGARFDGDEFAPEALAAGALAVVVREETAARLRGRPCLVVDDGVKALGAVARAVRLRSGARVVAVTGSAGKTSTKDILAALLAPVCRVVATTANLNNEIGLPLTLLRLEPSTDVAVVELAMRGPGQIRELARIARPDIGVITTIAPVHLEFVGTLQDVAAAKAELIEELEGGTAVVPGDAPLLAPHLRRHAGRLVTFGTEESDVHVVSAERRGDSTHALIDAFTQRALLDFSFTGEHYLYDAQAALAAFIELGFRLDEGRTGARRVAFSDLRGEVLELGDGTLLLNDAYNANPVASEAALDHLAELAGGRPLVAVLGDMYELGAAAAAYHGAVGEHAAALGARLVAVGDLGRHYLTGRADERWFATVEECLEALPELVGPGSAVLVKASRALRLERIATALKARADGSPAPDDAGPSAAGEVSPPAADEAGASAAGAAGPTANAEPEGPGGGD